MSNSMLHESVEDLEDDYYALLNLSKNATPEEIINAYRRLSRLYHPDKHIDPVNKKNAEILFNKTKVAYEVLNDPHQRAIYDTLGTKGLKTEGWMIIQRTKTPQEIREEYEQLLKVKEERELQQSTNAKGTTSIGINATDLFESYGFDSGSPIVEISSMSITQSVDAPLDSSETLNLNVSLGTQNGNGSGNINCSMKKIVSEKTWVEGGIGAGNGLLFNLKAFRTLTKYCFGTVHTTFHFMGSTLSPGVELMLARQLTKTTAGYLTWKAGAASSVNTTIIYDFEKNRFHGGLQFGFKRSYINLSYSRTLEDKGKLHGSLKFGVFGALLEYGCDKVFSQYSTVGAAMVVGLPSGVTLKIKVKRANQSFIFPILLSEELLPSAIFYGTVIPLFSWYILKKCHIDPRNRRQKQRELDKKKEANAQRIAEKRKEADIAISLMQETYKRIKAEEKKKNGLIILLSIYGSADTMANLNLDELGSQLDVLDVAVPLQCLVKDSRLTLPDRPKSNLPGFYDPCLGEDKCLRVDYSYRNKKYSITIQDTEILKLPRLIES